MKLHQLKYFLAVCKTQNFTRAAEICHVAQPSLTRAIKDLEAEFGGPLFVRGRHHALTSLGHFVRAHIERIEAEMSRVRTAVSCWRNLEAPLKIGVLDSVGPTQIMALVDRFRREHPQVDIELHQAEQERLESDIAGGELDLAFTVSDRRTDLRMAWYGLYREPFVVAFADGHRFAACDEVRLRDLMDETYLDRLNCEMRDELLRCCQDDQIRLKAAYRSNRDDWIQRAAAAGLGVAILPGASIVLPDLLSRPLVDPRMDREVGLLTLATPQNSPAAETFILQASAFPWHTPVH